MRDRLAEFAADLAAHWDDPYWWADHPALRMVGVALAAGAVGLLIEYLKLRMTAALTTPTGEL